MGYDLSEMICFQSITVNEPVIQKNKVDTTITLCFLDGKEKQFILRHNYPYCLDETDISFLRLACCMPLLNYGLFTQKIQLDFALPPPDITLLQTLNTIFSKDIYVNKILQQKTNYILSSYLLKPQQNVIQSCICPAKIIAQKNNIDDKIKLDLDPLRCGVLSSGGKESLLSYALLKEIGCEVYPFYINESGGHWRTALVAYRHHQQTQPHTKRVWTNVDRFYTFMLDNLFFIRKDHRNIWADTYPLRLCIFPFYIFSLLPLFMKYRIGNLLLGSEFDDIRSPPIYQGIAHYFGIYDQHQDYDSLMNEWYKKRIPKLLQWSAVRNISGLIVERILVKRYPVLASYQRSCHSCHIKNKQIIPCGSCSKCLGVLLFLLANNDDPTLMKLPALDAGQYLKQATFESLHLDEDEKNHCLYLIQKNKDNPTYASADHVEQIHHHSSLCDLSNIPNHLRDKLLSILEQYSKGYCILDKDSWKTITKNDVYTSHILRG
jgi:hypothetical protein